ncbi:MAG: hydrogenase expression/formation protein HypE [Candidatus Omnitrophica bacterium]|nr:hydrogenase expression/formation protein HypE [Candidatus Omnitrophota bacterium]
MKNKKYSLEDKILLAHGSGGKLMHQLLKEIIFKKFRNPILEAAEDAAIFRVLGKLALTTDSFVVKPLFFPGGDIGKLSICGTINDLAMMGAIPKYITVSCIIAEGFPIRTLEKIVSSIANTARQAKVDIIAGDFKVVEKNACDQIFINTSGIGLIEHSLNLSCSNVKVGDCIIINGTIGDHAASIMSARKSFGIESKIKSDCACLHRLVQEILKVSDEIHALRDPTRGGVATTLNEIAIASSVEMVIEEEQLPIRKSVLALCELLGIDPIYLANEGKVLVFCPEKEAENILSVMKRHPLGKNAAVIGRVTSKNKASVLLKTKIGSTRIIEMLTGEQLPRIC